MQRLLRQLLVAGHHAQPALLDNAGAAASDAAAVSAAAGACLRGRAHSTSTAAAAAPQAAAAQAAAAAPRQDEQHGARRPGERDAPPRPALPPPEVYGLKVTIKAHELKLVKLASTVIQDLALVNVAPKSRDVLPGEWVRERAGVPWVNLVVPTGAASPPVRRSHYTVISGPHVHKYAREQFARTTHTRVIKLATNSLAELQWLLDSIRTYNFFGCEVTMRITSSSYLLPTSSSQQDEAQRPLLVAHRQRFAQLFGAAAPGAGAQPRSSSYAGLQQSLQQLRDSLHQGLLAQRMQLGVNASYERWAQTQDQAASGAAAAAAAAAVAPQQGLRDAVARQVEGSSLLAAADNGGGGGSDGAAAGGQRGQALVEAVDKALLSIKADVLDRHKLLPYLAAFYSPGEHKVPAAEWMHAVMLYGKHRQAAVEGSQQHAALASYQQYGQVSRTMLLLLLQQYHQAADAAARRQLALPAPGQVEAMLAYRKREQEDRQQAGAGPRS